MTASRLDVLSPREREVADLIADGLMLHEIASQLGLSPKTIGNHRTAIGLKLRVKNRVQLARIVWEAGLVCESGVVDDVVQSECVAARSTVESTVGEDAG